VSTPFSSLYSRISLIFLVLIAVLGVVQVLLSTRSSMDYVQESDQALNRRLAADLAVVFEPFFADSLDEDAIGHAIHELMVMNPRVEIYILDEAGTILAYFAEPSAIKRMRVDVAPVGEFLRPGAENHLPILGDDPRSADASKPFSATPITIAGDLPGYVYVILGGQQYDSATEMIRGSYMVRTSVLVLGVTVLCTAVVGLLLFFLVTRRLTNLTRVLQRFHAGDQGERILVRSNDEIGRLGVAFNRMADTIAASMEKLKETDRLRRELVANVSHDLRSPLASMQGYLETILMKEETLSREERRRFLETILCNVRWLSKLVQQLFELSKLDATNVSARCEPFSIAELAQDVALMFRPQAESARIGLCTEIKPDLPRVCADIAMVERALTNLIENALRYTPAGGRALIKLDQDGERVKITVSDTGHGIPAEDLPHVFDRFYRADKSRSRMSGSTGLGLAIADKIVKAHGEKITVESTVNVGTSLSFGLPIYSDVAS
jgi:signal transduction histidine kinase